MADFDPYSALLADEPTALEMAKARAAALLGQNYAGMVMGLAHDPQAAKMGGELMQQAQTGQAQLGELPGQRMQRLLQQQHLQQQGPQEALGGQTPSVYEMLTKRAQVPKYASDMFGRYDTRTGAGVPISSADNPLAMSPAALDQAAELFARTGQLPPTVRGRSGPVVAKQIADRAATLHPDANLAENKATYKADTGSLGNQQKILDNAVSWERTGKSNLNVLMGIAQNLHDTGSPWLNQPVRRFFEKGIGDPNMTAFKAAHATVVNEYAKILSGSQGSGGVTEGARHEAESMLPLDATMEQLAAAAKVLDLDAGNRITSLRQQVGQTQARSAGRTTQAAETPASAATTKKKVYNPATGQIEEK
jgi:hypothetical protein